MYKMEGAHSAQSFGGTEGCFNPDTHGLYQQPRVTCY